MRSTLAILGGPKAVDIPHPHEVWPPNADPDELTELMQQRNTDISIQGRVGPIAELEDLFLQFLGGGLRYAVSFNSGTSALLAAYFALGIGEDDEVIGPALTYHAALSPVFFLKGNVVLVDVDSRTGCIDPRRIEEAITPKTKVITVVHQWGHPCEMDSILSIGDRCRLRVLEDCSHAHGSIYKGQVCGTFGDLAVFSLQANKALFAGEGGILVTNDETIYNRATLLGHYRDRSRQEIRDVAYQRYWVTGFGLKLRMSPFNAIIAKHAIRHFGETKRQRHQCLHYFRRQLEQISYIDPPFVADDVDMGAWYGFKPLYRPEEVGGLPRGILVSALQAEGVEVHVPSGPVLATLPLYNESCDPMFPSRTKRPNISDRFPVARHIEERALSLPTFTNWERDKEIIDQYICAFAKIASHYEELLHYVPDH